MTGNDEMTHTSDELCRQRYEDVSRQCEEIKTDLKNLRENHLHALEKEMNNLKISMAILTIIVLGVKAGEILKLIP